MCDIRAARLAPVEGGRPELPGAVSGCLCQPRRWQSKRAMGQGGPQVLTVSNGIFQVWRLTMPVASAVTAMASSMGSLGSVGVGAMGSMLGMANPMASAMAGAMAGSMAGSMGSSGSSWGAGGASAAADELASLLFLRELPPSTNEETSLPASSRDMAL
ncbi:unnamed protein product [Effrenium voratum]|nr:unnamed protein product [Effrenium voratum]